MALGAQRSQNPAGDRQENAGLGRLQLDIGIEPLAGTTLGNDELGCARIGFELAAKPQDLNIDVAAENFFLVDAAGSEKLLPAQDLLGRSDWAILLDRQGTCLPASRLSLGTGNSIFLP